MNDSSASVESQGHSERVAGLIVYQVAVSKRTDCLASSCT